MLFAFLLTITFIAETTMAYSTDADLYDRIDQGMVIQLTDDANAGVVDQGKVDNLRADCSELINTYLRGRYEVPLNPVPAILINIETDLLVNKLYSRRANYEIPESVKDAKKDAMVTLDKISKGFIQLEDQPDVGEAQIAINKTDSDRLFSDDVLNKL